MQVINRDQNGNEIDLTKITVPVSSAVYDVCKELLAKGESDDRDSHKDAMEEVKT